MSKNQQFTTSWSQKNSIPCRQKSQLWPVLAGLCFHGRDKIEPNLKSQNVRRTYSKLVESSFQRDRKITPNQRGVKKIPRNFRQLFFKTTIGTVRMIYRLRPWSERNSRCAKILKLIAQIRTHNGDQTLRLLDLGSNADLSSKTGVTWMQKPHNQTLPRFSSASELFASHR